MSNFILQKQLFSQPEANVFAVLDGASIQNLLEKLEQYQPEQYCLYRGELAADLAKVAPYLVRLEQGSEVLNWILSGFGKHWGIFAVAKANLRTMRQHFRQLLTVELAEGKVVYFRFYDPRVLRGFLPTCNAQQNQIMFGPILSYFTEKEDTQAFLYFPSENIHSEPQIERRMLVIREEQRKVLRKYMLKQFEERMAIH